MPGKQPIHYIVISQNPRQGCPFTHQPSRQVGDCPIRPASGTNLPTWQVNREMPACGESLPRVVRKSKVESRTHQYLSQVQKVVATPESRWPPEVGKSVSQSVSNPQSIESRKQESRLHIYSLILHKYPNPEKPSFPNFLTVNFS